MEFAPLAHASIFDETSIFAVTVFPRVAASVAISAFVGEVPDYDSGTCLQFADLVHAGGPLRLRRFW